MRHLKTVHYPRDYSLKARLAHPNRRGRCPEILRSSPWEVYGLGPRDGMMEWRVRNQLDGTEYVVFERLAPGGRGEILDWFTDYDPAGNYRLRYIAWRAANAIRELNASLPPLERITPAGLRADLERHGPDLWPERREALRLAIEYLSQPPDPHP